MAGLPLPTQNVEIACIEDNGVPGAGSKVSQENASPQTCTTPQNVRYHSSSPSHGALIASTPVSSLSARMSFNVNFDMNMNGGNISLNLSAVSTSLAQDSTDKNLTSSKLSLGKSYSNSIENAANETFNIPEKSRFFQYDNDGAITFFDASSPPLEVIDRILNNFRYDPTRSKCTGYTNALEHKSFFGQPQREESIISSNSMYITAKSHVSKTTNESSDALNSVVLNFNEIKGDENFSDYSKPQLETIQEDKNNSEQMDFEAEDTFCDVSHHLSYPRDIQNTSKKFGESNTACPTETPTEPRTAISTDLDTFSETVSFVKDVKFLSKTLKLSAEPLTAISTGLDSSSDTVSFVKNAKFLSKTPKLVEDTADKLSANLGATALNLKHTSTLKETQLTPKNTENNESSIIVPFSIGSIGMNENPDQNLEQLMSLAQQLAKSHVPACNEIDSALLDSVNLGNVSFNDESTFASQVFVMPEVSGIGVASTSSAMNINEESTAQAEAKSKIIPRKSKITSRRSSIHKRRPSITKKIVTAQFKSFQNEDESKKRLRRSVRLSTIKSKASATIVNNSNESGAVSVATTKPKGPIRSKLPTRRRTDLLQKNTKSISTSPVSTKLGCLSSTSNSTETNSQPKKGLKSALPKSTSQQKNAPTFVSRLPQKCSIPRTKLPTSARSIASESATLKNRTVSRQAAPKNVSNSRIFLNPYVSRTHLLLAVTPTVIKSQNLATKKPAMVTAESKLPKKRVGVLTESTIPPPKKRHVVTKYGCFMNSDSEPTTSKK